MVCTNTTIYRETDIAEIDELYTFLAGIGVDGFMVSPAYGYQAVHSTNPTGAAEIFMTRDDVRAKFKEAQSLFAKHKMMSSPIYLEFLSGKREL
ncbi:MAG: hopanoid biosynthesis associated radical SAM protein HpnH, partial [Betaproteobacteria bacterium]|nr:hopanoid biosynthesis associated radical SAM protein HpnH [Betaproteobacteria bacterium]